MPVMRMDADQPVPPALRDAARRLPAGAPVLVMLHGYRYSPAHPAHDPHRHILSPQAGPGGISWPQQLGFQGDPSEGLALACGWEARGRLRHAYDRAAGAGADLGADIDFLSAVLIFWPMPRPAASAGSSC